MMRWRRTPISSLNWLLVILLILLTALLWRERLLRAAAERQVVIPRGDLAEDEKSTIALFKTAAPSVVHVVCTRRDPQTRRIVVGTGSGFIWDTKGHVVTNYHVISKFGEFFVILSDGTRLAAQAIGIAPAKDLAVLQIDEPHLDRMRPLAQGRSDDLQVGQKVFAIGNPFRLDQTLTTGIISGLQREIVSATEVPIHEAIQTSASINPGNSGGPLLDSAGRVIGVNTLVFGDGTTGIGFAVPIDTVRKVVPVLIEKGKLERVGIGIRTWPDGAAQHYLDIEGVLVLNVRPGGPAAQAGIQPSLSVQGDWSFGDVIVGANHMPVATLADLHKVLDQFQAGEEVVITVSRNGAEKDIPVKVEVID
jgi:S1-C subfamily serine protease